MHVMLFGIACWQYALGITLCNSSSRYARNSEICKRGVQMNYPENGVCSSHKSLSQLLLTKFCQYIVQLRARSGKGGIRVSGSLVAQRGGSVCFF